MTDLSEIDKSKLRILCLILQHCCRYRLLDKKAADVRTAHKLTVVSGLLDLFESELERLGSDGGDDAIAGFECSGGKARTRKQSVDFGKNPS
ncbi:hypothetical protein SAMN05421688_3301 [Poseidonocella pacifica]|uniref:Uncharacterized protein n=1 Tax=Poseidonocella pacifica TaxID=871651 RepID=A0A1I0YRQ1_9RHOB|nr:hypothetical protein [Poseidonocella pacifica]SFB15892.1 hypothetical protein SAMN05421688_3301 [Poseidonocella pacifica]